MEMRRVPEHDGMVGTWLSWGMFTILVYAAYKCITEMP